MDFINIFMQMENTSIKFVIINSSHFQCMMVRHCYNPVQSFWMTWWYVVVSTQSFYWHDGNNPVQSHSMAPSRKLFGAKLAFWICELYAVGLHESLVIWLTRGYNIFHHKKWIVDVDVQFVQGPISIPFIITPWLLGFDIQLSTIEPSQAWQPTVVFQSHIPVLFIYTCI